MATLYTSFVNCSAGRIRLKVEYSVSNSTETYATIHGTVYLDGSVQTALSNETVTIAYKNVVLTIDGTRVISTGSSVSRVNTTSNFSTKVIDTFDKTINRTTTTRNVTIAISGELGVPSSLTSVSQSDTASISALRHFDIYYYTNGGSGSTKHYDGYYSQKHSIISLATSGFSRTGYTFLGWATSSNATAAAYVAGDSVTVNSNLNFYAVWKINSYTLTANANSGSISSTSGWSGTGGTATKSLNYGSAYSTLPTVSKSYYTLKGWYTASSGGSAVSTSTTIGASNTTIYAQWTPTSYSISYTLNGGSASNPATYTIESANFTLTNPTRTGYTFKGWSGTGLSGDSNKTVTITKGSTGARSYTANWTANTYTLTINPQSGTYNNTTSNSTKTMTYDSTNNNNIGKPTRTGYTFKGWYTSTGGGGTQVFTDSGAYNSNATSYWSSGKWHSAAALTVYAYWTINSYTLTANANNGSISSTSGWTGTGSTATKSVTYGNAYGTLPTVSRSYYTLKGWYTASSGGSAVSTSTTIGASNTTIYAQWTGVDYTISLNNQSATSGGTSSIFTRYATGIYLDSNHATAMTTSTNPITVPTRTGYTFKGYYTSTNGGGTQVISNTGYITTAFTNTLFHANSTIYAYWTINSYTLTANSGGGSILSTTGWSGTGNSATKSVTYNAKYGTLPSVSWSNHTFNKWVNSSGTTVTTDTTMGAGAATITAQWIGYKIAPVFAKTPQIQRCTSAGVDDDENKYCRIVITSTNGYHYQNDSNSTVTDSTTFSAKYRIQNTGSYTTAYLKKIQEDTTAITGDTAATSKSITAGKATIYLVTNNSGTPIEFDIQKVYDFEVTLTSANGQFVTKAGFLSAAYFPFDVNANATAIGLFRIAPNDQQGLFVNKAATFDSTINNFLIKIPISNLDANAVKDYNGIWISPAPITNAPMINHGVLLGIRNVETPFQFYIPDSTTQYVYKRSWDNTNSVWRSWAKLSAGYADSAGSASSSTNATNASFLTHKTLDSTTINNTAGSFAFSGSGEPWAGTDWVGFQIGDSVDKFQFTRTGVAPMFRYNDSGGTNSSDWSSWVTLYSTGNKPTAADVGALSLSGGTLTGSFNLKYSSVDASKTNNNISSTIYPTTFSLLDTSNRILARQEAIIYTDGRIGSQWYIRNYKTDGTQVAQKGIQMIMAKDGTLTYSVSDPAKFTTAISALPLAGGTMSGSIIMNNETSISGKIARKKADGGGWAYSPFRFTGNDNAMFAQIGALGSANTLTYTFIGSNNYDGNNLRVYPDGSTWTPTLTIQKGTVGTNTYADANPKILFKNGNDSQSISLTYTDYDSVQSPSSLTLNGNQGGEYFIAPNIKATSGLYAGALTAITSGRIWAGVDGNTSQENQLGARSGSGTIYMYSQASTTGGRGIYLAAHGSGGAHYVVSIDTNNNVTYYPGTIAGNTTLNGVLKLVSNGVTTDVGCQGSNFCHIYTDGSNGFAFNKSFAMVNSGTLGTSGYPAGGVVLGNNKPISMKTSGGTMCSIMSINGSDELRINNATSEIRRVIIGGNVLSSGNGAYNCGDTSNRWKYVYATETAMRTSDRKDKDILGSISYAHDLIMGLHPVEYMWKDGDHRRKRMGFVAQEVSSLCKNLKQNLAFVVAQYKDDNEKPYFGEPVDDELLNWSLGEGELIAPIVSVIQSQELEIQKLKQQLAELLQEKI